MFNTTEQQQINSKVMLCKTFQNSIYRIIIKLSCSAKKIQIFLKTQIGVPCYKYKNAELCRTLIYILQTNIIFRVHIQMFLATKYEVYIYKYIQIGNKNPRTCFEENPRHKLFNVNNKHLSVKWRITMCNDIYAMKKVDLT